MVIAPSSTPPLSFKQRIQAPASLFSIPGGTDETLTRSPTVMDDAAAKTRRKEENIFFFFFFLFFIFSFQNRDNADKYNLRYI